MKLLTFLAQRFAWTPHARTWEAASATSFEGEMHDCVVVFVHVETADLDPAAGKSALERVRKHVEWLARKGFAKRVVLHSFAHLGGDTGDPAACSAWIERLRERLVARGFEVASTPFGWTCAWDLSVRGEGHAKVWKELRASERGDDAAAQER